METTIIVLASSKTVFSLLTESRGTMLFTNCQPETN
jgi:hypothetical protein